MAMLNYQRVPLQKNDNVDDETHFLTGGLRS